VITPNRSCIFTPFENQIAVGGSQLAAFKRQTKDEPERYTKLGVKNKGKELEKNSQLVVRRKVFNSLAANRELRAANCL
jgi:hypothetical protein